MEDDYDGNDCSLIAPFTELLVREKFNKEGSAAFLAPLLVTNFPTLCDLSLYALAKRSDFRRPLRSLLRSHNLRVKHYNGSPLLQALDCLPSMFVVRVQIFVSHNQLMDLDTSYTLGACVQQESRCVQYHTGTPFGRGQAVLVDVARKQQYAFYDIYSVSVVCPCPPGEESLRQLLDFGLRTGLVNSLLLSQIGKEKKINVSARTVMGNFITPFYNRDILHVKPRSGVSEVDLNLDSSQPERFCEELSSCIALELSASLAMKTASTVELLRSARLSSVPPPREAINHLCRCTTHCDCSFCSFFRRYLLA